MQIKSSGIILHSLKYSDSSTIVAIFTRDFGQISYMAYGINKKSSICRAALLQPISLVEIDAVHLPNKDIQKLKDIKITYHQTDIPYNPIKNALALFLSEILFRSLKEIEANETLYAFLENSIQTLDCIEKGVANFHLVFLLKLTRFLGFEPNRENDNRKYFDLMNGVFVENPPMHAHFLKPEVTSHFGQLLSVDYSTMSKIVLTRQERMMTLEGIVEYYRLHIPNLKALRSLEVLQSLFD